MSNVSILSDLSELQNVTDTDSGKNVLDYFNAQLTTPLRRLAASRDQVDNAAGVYQVVKIETSEPFPQLLNYLCHNTAAIVSEQAVSALNAGIDANNYNSNSQTLYGDVSTVTKTSSEYNNQMWFSGPYALCYMDDYGVYFERNPAFMPGTEFVANIKNVTVKMINDQTTLVNALRNNDVDLAPPNGIHVQTCQRDPNLATISNSSDVVYYLTFNLSNSVMKDINLRKAVLYAIDQDIVIKVKNGMGARASSQLTMIPTGNVWNQDLNKARRFMNAYLNNTGSSGK
jgi:peptide/nickel transport system substrate-binding protein